MPAGCLQASAVSIPNLLLLLSVPQSGPAQSELNTCHYMLHIITDYDLQVAITEVLCRMTSEKQRGELASQWFSMDFVTSAFKRIKDSEFETVSHR